MANGRRPFGWERKAINFPIQSSSAEILKHVMAKITAKFDAMETSARLLLQIHDELIIEVKEEEADTIRLLVKEIFEDHVNDLGCHYDVPLTAEPTVQVRWAIKATKCPDCDLYGMILDGGSRVEKDPESGLDKIVPTKVCCRCTEVKHPGLWDLEETIRTIEKDAIMDEAA